MLKKSKIMERIELYESVIQEQQEKKKAYKDIADLKTILITIDEYTRRIEILYWILGIGIYTAIQNEQNILHNISDKEQWITTCEEYLNELPEDKTFLSNIRKAEIEIEEMQFVLRFMTQ